MQTSRLCALKFKVTVVEFIKPLSVFAHGVKLKLNHQGIEFTCNYNFPPFLYSGEENNLKELVKTHKSIYEEEFPPGKELLVEAWLEEHSEEHKVTAVSNTSLVGIREIGELDWELTAQVQSDVINEQMLIDCGFPVLAFAPNFYKRDSFVKCVGELMLFSHEI